MFKFITSYLTKGGETANFLSTKFYGDSSKAKVIIEGNSSTYDSLLPTAIKETYPLMANQYMFIPPPPLEAPKSKPAGTSKKQKVKIEDRSVPAKVDVSPDTVISGYSEEVSLFIDGKVFKYFDDVTISMSFDSIADTFSLSVPFDSKNTSFKKLMRPFSYKEVAIYIGGEKQLQGNIVSIKTSSDPSSRKLQIDGYSKTGILNDCCPSSQTKCSNVNGLDLMQIADLLCKPYGIEIIFEADIGAKFSNKDKIQIDPSKKIVDILTPLAKMRGLVISNTRHGELLFHKTDSDKAKIKIDSGQPPCTKSDANYNGQNRFSDITIVKKDKNGGTKVTVPDNELKKQGVFRQVIQSADSSESGNLKNVATAKVGRTIAESVQINADFFGWRNTIGEIWAVGEKIFYKSPDDFIYDYTEVLIKNVTLNRKNNEMTSSLNMCLPECYSGLEIKVYPWDL